MKLQVKLPFPRKIGGDLDIKTKGIIRWETEVNRWVTVMTQRKTRRVYKYTLFHNCHYSAKGEKEAKQKLIIIIIIIIMIIIIITREKKRSGKIKKIKVYCHMRMIFIEISVYDFTG